jgi:hypothetical protein
VCECYVMYVYICMLCMYAYMYMCVSEEGPIGKCLCVCVWQERGCRGRHMAAGWGHEGRPGRGKERGVYSMAGAEHMA